MATDDPARLARMLSAAKVVIDRGLRADDSVFTPGRAIWTAEHADELARHYVGNLEVEGRDFFEKLAAQLAPAGDGAVQLMAELLFVNMLPLADFKPSTKRRNLDQVLALMTERVEVPPDLDAALDAGAFAGGPAFKMARWAQLAFLVEFLVWWKGFDEERRRELLAVPYAFRDAVEAVPAQRAGSQRAALAYLAFPDTFEPIVSGDHKRSIREAFAKDVGVAGDDLDRDLATIRRALEARSDGPVDFYRPPWRERWKPVTPSPEAGHRAWFVRSGEGDDLVGRWVAEGWISRPAAHLEGLDPRADRHAIADAVEDGYSSSSPSSRTEKVDEVDAFLHRLVTDDLVLAKLGDHVYVGSVAGDAEVIAERGEGTRLRRPVTWRRDALREVSLPTDLRARLGARGMLEVTEHVDALAALLAGEVRVDPPDDVRLDRAPEELADRLLVPRAWLQECIDLLDEQRQLILYGPPGTGKTYLGRELAHHLAGRERTTLVQFHPAYSYEDFFEGYRPSSPREGTVGFTLTPGPFRRLVDQARENPGEAHVLIIDEINRGNLAKIFGELYFLLEYRDEAIDLLYGGPEGQAFTLPPNVFLIGTMNTADRSIALVDAAMRRRFAFVPLHPSEEPTRGLLRRWVSRNGLPDGVPEVHDRLNELIDDADMKIGPSYFMRHAVHREDAALDRVWRTSILPLLEEHHYGDGVDVRERYGLHAIRRGLTAT